MKTTAEIVEDPAFQGLPRPEQLKALSAVDKAFGGLPPQEQESALQSMQSGRPATPAQPTEEVPAEKPMSGGDMAKRGVQLVGGSLAQGLAMLLGAPSDIAETAVNALSSYRKARAQNPDIGFPDVGAFLGGGITQGAMLAKRGMAQDPKDKVDLPFGGEELNAMLPDGAKPPKDMNMGERVLSRTIQEVGSAAVPIAASLKLLSHVDPKKLIAIETALAAAGGFTAQSLKEMVPDAGALTEFMGELLGSFGPTGALKLIRKTRDGIASLTGLRTEAELEKEIGKQLNKVSSPEDVRKGIEKTEELQKDMPGFNPTTAQVSGSPGMVQQERALQRSSGEATHKGKVTLQQNQEVVNKFLHGQAPDGKLEDTVAALEATKTRETAMLDAGLIHAQAEVDLAKKNVSATTERIVHQADDRAKRAEDAAQARVNALQGRITKGEAGQILRREYQSELNTFRETASAKYQDIDPRNEIHLPLKPLKDAVERVERDFLPRVEGADKLPLDDIGRIKALGRNWEMESRAEKALDDLSAVGGKGKDQRGGFRLQGETQGQGGTNDVIGIRSNYPPWYRELATGQNAMDRETIEKALESIKTGKPSGLEQKTIDHVKKALYADREFTRSPYFHEAMDTVGKDTETFGTIKALESQLHAQIRKAGAEGNDVLSRRLNQLLDGVKDTMDQLDGPVAQHWPDASAKYHDANEFYAKGVDRLKAGEAAALRSQDKWGRFRVHDEDAAAGFLKGETPVNDFVQALGSREAARDALKEFAKSDLYHAAVYPDMHPKAGQINQAAAAKWVQNHEQALTLFPEVKAEVGEATKWQGIADSVRKEADALAKNPQVEAKVRNPKVFGELDEVERKHAALLEAREQNLKGWQKSLASDFMGRDADRVAQVVVRSARPQTEIADIAKRIGTDPDAQQGFSRALWDAALDKFSVDILDAGGNRALQAKKMEKFLSQNEGWMTERFGEAKVASMRKSAEAMRMLESTGKPVLSGGSDTFANLSNVLTDWGPFLSRVYAERSGRASLQWVISERWARGIGKMLKARTEEGAMELLDRAFYDPKVAESMMLAARGANDQLMQKRFHFHLGTPFGADVSEQDKEEKPQQRSDASNGARQAISSVFSALGPNEASAADDWKSSRVKEKDGKIYYGGTPITESELESTLQRIESMRSENKRTLEGARNNPDLRRMLEKAAALADQGQDETYRVGSEILKRRRAKK